MSPLNSVVLLFLFIFVFYNEMITADCWCLFAESGTLHHACRGERAHSSQAWPKVSQHRLLTSSARMCSISCLICWTSKWLTQKTGIFAFLKAEHMSHFLNVLFQICPPFSPAHWAELYRQSNWQVCRKYHSDQYGLYNHARARRCSFCKYIGF